MVRFLSGLVLWSMRLVLALIALGLPLMIAVMISMALGWWR